MTTKETLQLEAIAIELHYFAECFKASIKNVKPPSSDLLDVVEAWNALEKEERNITRFAAKCFLVEAQDTLQALLAANRESDN